MSNKVQQLKPNYNPILDLSIGDILTGSRQDDFLTNLWSVLSKPIENSDDYKIEVLIETMDGDPITVKREQDIDWFLEPMTITHMLHSRVAGDSKAVLKSGIFTFKINNLDPETLIKHTGLLQVIVINGIRFTVTKFYWIAEYTTNNVHTVVDYKIEKDKFVSNNTISTLIKE